MKNTLFRVPTSSEQTSFGIDNTWWVPQRTGIFYVRRRGVAVGGDQLELPGKIYVHQPLIIIVEDGDLKIPKEIRSKQVNGAPEKLFTLIARTGNIYIDTVSQLDAYLVALARGPLGRNYRGGGRVLAGTGVTKLNIFGGLAAWELGQYYNSSDVPTGGSPIDQFYKGGRLQYNPRFNPAAPTYAESHVFVMEDKASEMLITGAD